MSDSCPKGGSTDVADPWYPKNHRFTKKDKAHICLDCGFNWGKA